MITPLLEVSHLKVHYPIKAKGNLLKPKHLTIKAVDDISFIINAGETFGLVGESGCGKSTTGKTIVQLLRPTAGKILYQGSDIFGENAALLSQKIQIIFQDPYSSLDPRFTIGQCIAEPMVLQHKLHSGQIRDRVLKLMLEMGLNSEYYTRYPHELSGGMRQRVGIARALSVEPELIICDEPVSSLDVSIQAQILNMMVDLQKRRGLTYLFISHNLSVVHFLCDRLAIMYLGNIVEIASKRSLFSNPMHPYTQALLQAVPVPNPDKVREHVPLQGDVPSPQNPPIGCCFNTRCPKAFERCYIEKPLLLHVDEEHQAACHLMKVQG